MCQLRSMEHGRWQKRTQKTYILRCAQRHHTYHYMHYSDEFNFERGEPKHILAPHFHILAPLAPPWIRHWPYRLGYNHKPVAKAVIGSPLPPPPHHHLRPADANIAGSGRPVDRSPGREHCRMKNNRPLLCTASIHTSHEPSSQQTPTSPPLSPEDTSEQSSSRHITSYHVI